MLIHMHHLPEFAPVAKGKYAKTCCPDPETARTVAGPNASVSEIVLSDGNMRLSDVFGGLGYNNISGFVGCAVMIP